MQVIHSNEVTWETVLVRFLVSFILGGLVGFERETRSQPAGLRTHILISIGSTTVMLISIFISQIFEDADPGRIASQVVSGIGFLGAGAILKFGTGVKGITTAASIWVMAAIGLAIGAGMFYVGLIGFAVVFFALTAMNLFEKKLVKGRSLRRIELSVKKKGYDIENFSGIMGGFDMKIISTGFDRNVGESTDKLTYLVEVTEALNVKTLSDELEKQHGVVAITIEII